MTFADDKAYARSPEHHAARTVLYREMFADYAYHFEVPDAPSRRHLGIDYVVLLEKGGCSPLIQEKLRRKDYGDFLCEAWSQFYKPGDRSNKVGWTFDTRHVSDCVTYIVVPTKKVYVMNSRKLLAAAQRMGEQWRIKYGYCPTPRDNPYLTYNIAVPWDKLAEAMGEEPKIYKWDTEAI